MVAKLTKNTAIILLAMILSLFIGGMITEMQPHADMWGDDFDVDETGNVKSSTKDTQGAFGKIITKYKTFITFVSGLGSITMIAIFIFHFVKLGSTAANPSERAKCTTALIWSGLAAAGLGSVALIVGVFYQMFA